MSTEWFISAYFSGEDQPIPTQKIKDILSTYKIVRIGENLLNVALPEGDQEIYVDYFAKTNAGVMISRPLVSDTLNRIIYEIMQCGNFIFYAPGGNFPILLSDDVAKELPDGMLDALGQPRIAENFASFSRLLKEMYE